MSLEIEFIIYDFDGVMTDNRVLVMEDGKEAVMANRSDGLAVGILKKMRIEQIIISTEKNSVVGARALKLGIPCLQAVENKKVAVEEYLKNKKYDPQKVAYVGNDLNDLEAMKIVGWPIAPADAHPGVKKIAKIVLETKGGYGVVRELLDKIADGVKR